VPLVVVYSSLFPPGEAVRASAMLTLVGSVGRVLATSATGSLNQLGGYSLAFYVAVVAAILSVLIVLPVREKPRPSQSPSLAGIMGVIGRRDVLLPSLLNAINQYAVWAATFGFLPILAKQLGATDVLQSMLVSLHIGITILGNLAATAIVKRVGAHRLVYFSFILLPAGIAGLGVATSLPLLFAAQFGVGLATGIAYPVLMGMSIQRVVDVERTTAMGLHQAVYALGMFGGPWVSGWVANAIGIRPMFGVTAFFCLVAGLLLNRWLAAKH
jgi:predicted MFS family arabinose efflux permease